MAILGVIPPVDRVLPPAVVVVFGDDATASYQDAYDAGVAAGGGSTPVPTTGQLWPRGNP